MITLLGGLHSDGSLDSLCWVKLTGVDDMKHGLSYFHLYNSLKGCCNLEFNVPIPVETHYAVEANASPLLVSIFISHKIKFTYFVIAFTWIHLGIITGAWVISRSRVEAVEDKSEIVARVMMDYL